MRTTKAQKEALTARMKRAGFPHAYRAQPGDRVTTWLGSPPKRTGHCGTVTSHKLRGHGPQILWDNGEKSRMPWWVLEKVTSDSPALTRMKTMLRNKSRV